MLSRLRLRPRAIRRLGHWGMELLVVAAGVLLALWAQAWFEGRREAAVHRDTRAQMDALLRRALTQTAARVSASACSERRITALDEALQASTGQWRAMPLSDLPERMRAGRFPPVYLADADVLPVQIFDTARQNGTLASLPSAERQFYERLERQMQWLNGMWVGNDEHAVYLSVLTLDGALSESARDRLRQDLAWLDAENRVTNLRARSLAQLAREHGVRLDAADLAGYREKLERDRALFGDCVVEVDPLTLAPVRDDTARPGH